MAGSNGQTTDTLIQQLAQQPFAFDFFRAVRLLESQLKDQQNRFEAGTVPRFNVLQAQVQLYNQIPLLITARNNYRISILTLAKTLGLDFNPARGVAAPLRAVGELIYIHRDISLLAAVEMGKRNRPFLKQARANVLNQIEQVHVAIGSWLPNVNANGGGEWVSSPINSSFGDVSKGWLTTATASTTPSTTSAASNSKRMIMPTGCRSDARAKPAC